MGCVTSLYTTSDAHDMASNGRANAAADAGSSPAQQQMMQHAAGDRRTAGAAASELPERLSPQALARMRQTFTAEASAGAVQDAYTLGKTLGSGGYAVVVHAVHKATKTEAAVKIMRVPAAGAKPTAQREAGVAPARKLSSEPSVLLGAERQTREEDVLKELHVLKAIDHPSLLRLREYFIDGDKVYIVTDLLRDGELLDALLERGSYSERDARTIFKSILQGVQYLHSKGITHRDLKLENLLLADKADLSSVRLADFGMARMAFDPAEDAQTMNLVCGTPAYVAPEIILGRRYTSIVDMWSTGVILFILLSGVVPFEDKDEKKLIMKIATGNYSVKGPEWKFVSEDAKSIVRELLCMEPRRRLTATAALAHPWMTGGEAAVPSTALPASQGGLRAYAERMKLPVRVYPAGAYLILQDELATEVLLIRRGRCDIIFRDAPGADGGGNAILRLIAQRGPGEFVGEMGLLMNDGGQIVLPDALNAAATTALAAAGPVAAAPASEEQLQMDATASAVAASGGELRAGGRRTASVRAVGEVEVVVLRAQALRWVLANDNGVRQELCAAIRLRQHELLAARELNAVERAAAAGTTK